MNLHIHAVNKKVVEDILSSCNIDVFIYAQELYKYIVSLTDEHIIKIYNYLVNNQIPDLIYIALPINKSIQTFGSRIYPPSKLSKTLLSALPSEVIIE